MVNVQHLLTGLVFVMAQVDISVGGGIASGDDSKTKKGQEK
jgi:hypothetical protein